MFTLSETVDNLLMGLFALRKRDFDDDTPITSLVVDSLYEIELIVEIEDHFGLENLDRSQLFQIDETTLESQVNTVGQLKHRIEKLLAEKTEGKNPPQLKISFPTEETHA